MSIANDGSRVVWVTASGTALDHAVTPRNSRFGGCGNHVSVCGAEFRPAPLVADPGRPCAACIRALAAGEDFAGAEHYRDEDESPLARWWNSFRPLNLVTPVASQCDTRRASPGEATGNCVWRDSVDNVPRPLCPESRHTLMISSGLDPDATKRRYPTEHLLRHFEPTDVINLTWTDT